MEAGFSIWGYWAGVSVPSKVQGLKLGIRAYVGLRSQDLWPGETSAIPGHWTT